MFPDYKLLATFNLDEVGFIIVLVMVAAALIPTAKAFDSYLYAILCLPLFLGSAVGCNMAAIALGFSFDFQEVYVERYVNLAVATGIGMTLVFLVVVMLVAAQRATVDLKNGRHLGGGTSGDPPPLASKDIVSALRKSR